MELALPFGSKKITFDIPYPPANLAIAQRRPLPMACKWEDAADRALRASIGARPLAEMHLKGKTAAILLGAGAQAVPAREVMPTIIEHLNRAGVDDDDITIVAACADNTIPASEMRQQLGPELSAQCAHVCHDAYEGEHRFRGFSALGTPIFINKVVADAEFRMAVGTVRPHAIRGYSGGDDAVLPGVCSFETILRNQALSFAANSSYGHLGDNPCRLDTENAGDLVGLDYILNYVVTLAGAPAAAFAGDPVKAHRSAVNFGDRMIWGAELGGPADAAMASPGHEWSGDVPFDPRAVDFVAAGVKLGGSIIYLAGPGPLPEPDDQWQRELAGLSVGGLARLYERRNWPGERSEISARLAAVTQAYLLRRPFFCRSVILVGSDLPSTQLDHLGAEQTETMAEAVEIIAARHGPDARVAMVPDAATTLCLPGFH